MENKGVSDPEGITTSKSMTLAWLPLPVCVLIFPHHPNAGTAFGSFHCICGILIPYIVFNTTAYVVFYITRSEKTFK